MAIHFKPILNLSNLIFLGLFLLVVQLQNSAVEAEDENLGRHVRHHSDVGAVAALECDDDREDLCKALKCGATQCVQNTIDDVDGPPCCECTGTIDAEAAKTAKCMPVQVDSSMTAETPDLPSMVTTITPEICQATCKQATDSAAAYATAITNAKDPAAADAAKKDTPPTYNATVCADAKGNANCVCSPAASTDASAASGPADEEKVDELIETAKAVISGLVNAIIAFVQDLVKALVDLITSLANLPLADILTGLVGSITGIVGDIGGADDSK